MASVSAGDPLEVFFLIFRSWWRNYLGNPRKILGETLEGFPGRVSGDIAGRTSWRISWLVFRRSRKFFSRIPEIQ